VIPKASKKIDFSFSSFCLEASNALYLLPAYRNKSGDIMGTEISELVAVLSLGKNSSQSDGLFAENA